MQGLVQSELDAVEPDVRQDHAQRGLYMRHDVVEHLRDDALLAPLGKKRDVDFLVHASDCHMSLAFIQHAVRRGFPFEWHALELVVNLSDRPFDELVDDLVGDGPEEGRLGSPRKDMAVDAPVELSRQRVGHLLPHDARNTSGPLIDIEALVQGHLDAVHVIMRYERSQGRLE